MLLINVLKSLYWLPINLRTHFQILSFTYKCANGLAPQSLCEVVIPLKPCQPLRCDALELLELPKTRFRSYGGSYFTFVAASKGRNYLFQNPAQDFSLQPTF